MTKVRGTRKASNRGRCRARGLAGRPFSPGRLLLRLWNAFSLAAGEGDSKTALPTALKNPSLTFTLLQSYNLLNFMEKGGGGEHSCTCRRKSEGSLHLRGALSCILSMIEFILNLIRLFIPSQKFSTLHGDNFLSARDRKSSQLQNVKELVMHSHPGFCWEVICLLQETKQQPSPASISTLSQAEVILLLNGTKIHVAAKAAKKQSEGSDF